MKKHLLSRIGKKIDQNRVVKNVEKKLQFLNHLFETKDGMVVNTKQHTIQKSWTPFERRILNLTR